VEFRDKLTGGHISRTRLYIKALIDEMSRNGIYSEETSKWDLDFFLPSVQLHDVGKIAIPDTILNKPGKLTPDEFEIMKTHVNAGVLAIKTIMNELGSANEHQFLSYALLFAETHHEKWDGTGYPKGLKGKDIPLEGRLMAIADVYDALISVRAYKEAFTHEESCEIIINSSGTHFDPVLVDVFCRVEDNFKQITMEINART
jgi:putative two-component system response regulator